MSNLPVNVNIVGMLKNLEKPGHGFYVYITALCNQVVRYQGSASEL
jgi:hypothetical protein